MMKTFEINGRTFAVVSYISDENCYRLVYLPNPEISANGPGAINVIDDTACEDYYGDIETVAGIMMEQIREELADVLSYCILLADVCGLDLDEIMNEKVAKNEAKYPVEKAWGSAAKYTEFSD